MKSTPPRHGDTEENLYEDEEIRNLRKKEQSKWRKRRLSLQEDKDLKYVLERAIAEDDYGQFLRILREDLKLKDDSESFRRCVKWWHEMHPS